MYRFIGDSEIRLYFIVEYKDEFQSLRKEAFCLLRSSEMSYNELEMFMEMVNMFELGKTIRYEDAVHMFDVFNIIEKIRSITSYMPKIKYKSFLLYVDDMSDPDMLIDLPHCN